MKKLALNIEDLEVESFETRNTSAIPGTVNARDAEWRRGLNPIRSARPSATRRTRCRAIRSSASRISTPAPTVAPPSFASSS